VGKVGRDQGDSASVGGGSWGSGWWSHPQGNLLGGVTGGHLVQGNPVTKGIEGVSVGFRSQGVNKKGEKSD